MKLTPTLSICIPTYNRADLLRDLLVNLTVETSDSEKDVEVVVIDNCF